MEKIACPIPDLFILKPRIFADERGYFYESYNKKALYDLGIDIDFIQDNQSSSAKNVLRGLHYQLAPYQQNKLLRVVQGCVFDVAVDIRRRSPTFGKWYGVELSAENQLQFLIPAGFAHGFSVLSETAVVSYKCDNYYEPTAEAGIYFADKELNIDWQIADNQAIVSEKDRVLPAFAKAEMNF